MAYDDKARKAQEQGFMCIGLYSDKEILQMRSRGYYLKGYKIAIIKNVHKSGLPFYELWVKF